jgi:C4-dicarboxylate-specific signal transduction histidine kinase
MFVGPRTERTELEHLRAQLNRQGTFVGEAHAYRRDGSAFHVRLNVSPLKHGSDGRGYYIAVVHEVAAASEINAHFRHQTDSRAATVERLGQEAKRLNDQLAHIARLNTLGDLAGRLAHELNQPLTAISNYAQGCANRVRAQQIDTDELLKVMEAIRDAVFRAGTIVERLREFVRRKGPQQVKVDLEALIRHLLDLIEPEIRQSGAHVELDLPRDLPQVYVDSLQVEQAIVNLVRNALESMDATPHGERRLSIRAHRKSEREVEVAVCDRGRGLRGEAGERLFEPFYSTKPFGLGMGLPVSRSIFQWHGGRLWVDTNYERGACFRFTLPITYGAISNGDGD